MSIRVYTWIINRGKLATREWLCYGNVEIIKGCLEKVAFLDYTERSGKSCYLGQYFVRGLASISLYLLFEFMIKYNDLCQRSINDHGIY